MPQAFTLEDSVDLWTGSEVTTGWVPAGSPLQFAVSVESSGGAVVSMDGEGHLRWPSVFSLDLVPEAESGWVGVDAALEIVTAIRFDVGSYSWSQEIDRRGVRVEGEEAFTPFLLAGDQPARVQVDYTGTETELVGFDVSVFTGVNVTFAMVVAPEAATTFEGVRWWTEDGAMAEAGASAAIEPSGEDWQVVDSTFVGRWTSQLDLVLAPVFGVETPFDDVELVRIDLPIPLGRDDFEREFPATVLDFPLPVLVEPVEAYDFGEVEVGEVRNWELEVVNDGALFLEGATVVSGSPFFTVFPDGILAEERGSDGLMVVFSPEVAGEVTGTIRLLTNDPIRPEVEVLLTGTGVDESDSEGDQSAQRVSRVVETEVGCGCSSTESPAAPVAVATALLGLVGVRRRRDRGQEASA